MQAIEAGITIDEKSKAAIDITDIHLAEYCSSVKRKNASTKLHSHSFSSSPLWNKVRYFYQLEFLYDKKDKIRS